jgi:sulfate adenylyltransferase large subunit
MLQAFSAVPTDIEDFLEKHQSRTLLRFVTIGSVDDGKSTLIGRLLHDTQGVYEDHLADATVRNGAGSETIDLSRLTDGLRAEREQGITIDVAYRYFATEKRKFIIADTPGHIQYTRNMATGASTSSLAIILIDARLGVLPQSRRHACIASLLGIPNLLVAINKMDLVDFQEDVFSKIQREFVGFAEDLNFRSLQLIPISALEGDNVVHHSTNTPWYNGPTVLEYLEELPVHNDRTERSFRFPVQRVVRPHLDYRGFAGQVTSGTIRVGDRVRVLPSGKVSTVVGIDLFEDELEEAFAPQSVTLRLEDEIDISRGDLLVKLSEEPLVSEDWDADVVWMDETPLDRQKTYLLKHTTRWLQADIQQVHHVLDRESFVASEGQTLQLNDIGRLRINVNRPLLADRYSEDRSTGAFILIDPWTHNTVAAGMLVHSNNQWQHLEEQALDVIQEQWEEARRLGPVLPSEKAQRWRHTGQVLRVVGEEELVLDTVISLERLLFERGLRPVILDNDQFSTEQRLALAEALARQGALVLVPEQSDGSAGEATALLSTNSPHHWELRPGTTPTTWAPLLQEWLNALRHSS